MVNFFGFPAEMCRPAPHRERRASLVSEKRDGEMGALSERTEENPSVPGGAAGAHSAHKAWAGPLAPAPALVLRALRARKTPPPPGAHPTAPCYPTPTAPLAVLRRLPGGAGRLGRTPGGRRRLAGPAAPWGRRAAKQNSEPGAKGPGLAISGRFASSRRPPRRVFRQRQKGSANSSPAPPHPGKGGSGRKPVSQGHGTRNAVRKGQDAGSLRGQSPGPRVTGPGGTARPAAGYGLRPPAPAVARFSPPA